MGERSTASRTKFARRLLENAAVLQVAASGGEIVNDKGFPPGELWEL